jgi:hypothetical protein
MTKKQNMNRILTFATVLAIMFSLNNAGAQVTNIYVNASQMLHTNTTYMTGACLEKSTAASTAR